MPIVRPDDPVRLVSSLPIVSIEPNATLADLAGELERQQVGVLGVTTGDGAARVVLAVPVAALLLTRYRIGASLRRPSFALSDDGRNLSFVAAVREEQLRGESIRQLAHLAGERRQQIVE